MDPLTHAQNLERFGELVLADRKLYDELRTVEDLPAFVTLTIRLGAERGLAFTKSAVEEALRKNHREWLERRI